MVGLHNPGYIASPPDKGDLGGFIYSEIIIPGYIASPPDKGDLGGFIYGEIIIGQYLHKITLFIFNLI
jgi:hypothetical protein